METSASTKENVSLASMTTLAIGGAARLVAMPIDEAETIDVFRAAAAAGERVHVIGGGSNVLASDDGLDGVVIRSSDFGIDVRRRGDVIELDVGAGVEWDELVTFCVSEGYAGIECLSGIPGLVGAAPIQNIGAYGQEVREAVVAVRSIDRLSADVSDIAAADCGFGYRTSRFKSEWRDRCFVSRVTFRLTPGGEATVRYPELVRALGMREGSPAPPLETVRSLVLRIRRKKSMVYDRADPNHRSAGSFFTNPIVDAALADAAAAAAAALGVDSAMPRWSVDGGEKLSAAWLIERAGFERGFVFGTVGLSSNHCLALVNRGGASATDVITLAALVRRRVRATFGVTLEPEPAFVGFDRSVEELLG